jgi:uncharacterized protein (DUF433 family)
MLMDRITVIPGLCGGRPTIRGLRFTVANMLDMLASGMTHAEILEAFPYLEEADIQACLIWAARSSDHPIVISSRVAAE